MAVSDPDRLCGTMLKACGASGAFAFIKQHRVFVRIQGYERSFLRSRAEARSYMLTLITMRVPSPTTEDISILSLFFFIFGKPIPAPNPSERTLSGAVE